MRAISSFAVLAVAIFAFAACNSTDRKAANGQSNSNTQIAKNKLNPADASHADGARRIDVKEAENLIAKGQAVMIDVRNQAAYDQGHIRGAKLIPVQEVANRIGELPRDKTIITYCS